MPKHIKIPTEYYYSETRVEVIHNTKGRGAFNASLSVSRGVAHFSERIECVIKSPKALILNGIVPFSKALTEQEIYQRTQLLHRLRAEGFSLYIISDNMATPLCCISSLSLNRYIDFDINRLPLAHANTSQALQTLKCEQNTPISPEKMLVITSSDFERMYSNNEESLATLPPLDDYFNLALLSLTKTNHECLLNTSLPRYSSQCPFYLQININTLIANWANLIKIVKILHSNLGENLKIAFVCLIKEEVVSYDRKIIQTRLTYLMNNYQFIYLNISYFNDLTLSSKSLGHLKFLCLASSSPVSLLAAKHLTTISSRLYLLLKMALPVSIKRVITEKHLTSQDIMALDFLKAKLPHWKRLMSVDYDAIIADWCTKNDIIVERYDWDDSNKSVSEELLSNKPTVNEAQYFQIKKDGEIVAANHHLVRLKVCDSSPWISSDSIHFNPIEPKSIMPLQIQAYTTKDELEQQLADSTSETMVLATYPTRFTTEWMALPSYWAFETMRGFVVKSPHPIEIGYCSETQQYYFKAKDKPFSETLWYLLEKNHAHKQIIPESCLPIINQIKAFKSEELRLPPMLNSDDERWQYLLAQATGSCAQRAVVASHLLKNIEQLHIVSNDTHAFIEINGVAIDLGGSPATIIKYLPHQSLSKVEEEGVLSEEKTELDVHRVFDAIQQRGMNSVLVHLPHNTKIAQELLFQLELSATIEGHAFYCITTPEDADCTSPYLMLDATNETGVIHREPGNPLYRFLTSLHKKAYLFVDTQGFNTYQMLVRVINGLLDQTREIDGIAVPRTVQIIILLDPRFYNVALSDPSFCRRFEEDCILQSSEILNEICPKIPVSDHAQQIPIYRTNPLSWKEDLLGYYSPDGAHLRFHRGILEGLLPTLTLFKEKPASLVFYDFPAQADELFKRLRTIGVLSQSGTIIKIPPHISIQREDSPYDINDVVIRQCNVPSKNDFILNEASYAQLFYKIGIDNANQLRREPGELELSAGRELVLWVTQSLEPWQWKMIVRFCRTHSISLVIKTENIQLLPEPFLEGLSPVITTLPESMLEPIPCIVNEDLLLVVADLKLSQELIPIDITGMDFFDLVERLEGRFDEQRGAFCFERTDSCLKKSMREGKKVLLYGHFSKSLQALLYPFLHQQRYDNNCIGQLMLVSTELILQGLTKEIPYQPNHSIKTLLLHKTALDESVVQRVINENPEKTFTQLFAILVNGPSTFDGFMELPRGYFTEYSAPPIDKDLDLSMIQRGESCKLAALSYLLDYRIKMQSPKPERPPLYSDKSGVLSIRRIAKENGSQVGEVYSIEQLERIAQQMGFPLDTKIFKNSDDYIKGIEELLLANHPVMVIFDVDLTSSLPTVRPDNPDKNEHAALIVGVDNLGGSKRFIARQWGRKFHFCAQDLAASALSLGEREGECFIKKNRAWIIALNGSSPNQGSIRVATRKKATETTFSGAIFYMDVRHKIQKNAIQFMENRSCQVLRQLEQWPLVFLSGMSGVGKTFFVRNVLSQYATIFLLSQIKEWALSEAKLPILFVDEATLERNTPSLFSLFDGFIVLGGEIYTLKQHRVVMAGNPVNYSADRYLPPILKAYGGSIMFPPIPSELIINQCLIPISPIEWGANTQDEVHQALIKIYVYLINHSQDKVLITPREIITALELTIIEWRRSNKKSSPLSIAKQMIYQISEPLVPEHLLKDFAVFQQILPANVIALTIDNAKYRAVPSQYSAIQMVDNLLRLSLLDRENPKREGRGIRTLVIEGPSGIGKTALLEALFAARGYIRVTNPLQKKHTNQRTVFELPAGASISQKMKMLTIAFWLGLPTICNELDTIGLPKEFLNALLEGHLPDTEISHAAVAELQQANTDWRPGFCLIGTQNGSAYSGRSVQSPDQEHRMLKVLLKANPGVANIRHYTKKRGLQFFSNLYRGQIKKTIDIDASIMDDKVLEYLRQLFPSLILKLIKPFSLDQSYLKIRLDVKYLNQQETDSLKHFISCYMKILLIMVNTSIMIRLMLPFINENWIDQMFRALMCCSVPVGEDDLKTLKAFIKTVEAPSFTFDSSSGTFKSYPGCSNDAFFAGIKLDYYYIQSVGRGEYRFQPLYDTHLDPVDDDIEGCPNSLFQ